MEPWMFVWLAVQVQCAIGCMVIADSKNLGVGIWALCGVLFGIIGVLMAIGVMPGGREEVCSPSRRPRVPSTAGA